MFAACQEMFVFLSITVTQGQWHYSFDVHFFIERLLKWDSPENQACKNCFFSRKWQLCQKQSMLSSSRAVHTQQGSELAEPEGIVTCQCYRECWFLWLLWLIQRWGFRRHAPMLQWPLSLRGWYLFEEAGWMRLPSSYRLYLLPYSSTPTHSKLGMGSSLSPLQLLGVWLRYGVASTDPQCHQWLPDCLAATRYLWKRESRNVSC